MSEQSKASIAWTPRPADLSGVRLTAPLEALAERLARDIHDIWAQERIREGWRYGPHRSDEARQTPCLVPYDALPESERLYDRRIAERTLRTLLALGYDITPRAPRE